MTRLSDGATGSLRYSIAGEGHCRLGLEVLSPFPAAGTLTAAGEADEAAAGAAGMSSSSVPPPKVVLWVSRKGSTFAHPRPGELSPVETERVTALRHANHLVLLLDVCGFGTLADKHGDAFGAFELPSYDFRVKLSQPVDVAFNLNRSIVGIHAVDILTAALVFSTKGGLPGLNLSCATTVAGSRRTHIGRSSNSWCEINAVVSTNETAAAALSAALVSGSSQHGSTSGNLLLPKLGAVAVLGSIASWESIVLAPRFDMSGYFSFVFGGLKHFDIPDMLAALPNPAFVSAPLDAMRRPLNASTIAKVYSYARASNPRLSVDDGEGSVTAALMKWLSSTI